MMMMIWFRYFAERRQKITIFFHLSHSARAELEMDQEKETQQDSISGSAADHVVDGESSEAEKGHEALLSPRPEAMVNEAEGNGSTASTEASLDEQKGNETRKEVEARSALKGDNDSTVAAPEEENGRERDVNARSTAGSGRHLTTMTTTTSRGRNDGKVGENKGHRGGEGRRRRKRWPKKKRNRREKGEERRKWET